MKSIYKSLFCGLFSCLLLASCEKEDSRTVFPHSTPVIESATINPGSFQYGDSVTITAKVSDPVTPLSTLELKMVVNDVLIAQESFRTDGKSTDISYKFKVAYTSQLTDNADVQIMLSLINVEGDETKGSIDGIKGNRTYHNKLYLVLDDGNAIILTPESPKSNKYSSGAIKIKSNNIKYRIAEKLTPDNLIDFTGFVWGNRAGKMQIINQTGDFTTSENSDIDYITKITFDNFDFETEIVGDKLNLNDLSLDAFADANINGEAFKKLSRSFEKNQEITLFDDLADVGIVFDMTYFERTAIDKIKYVGETGTYDMYYNPSRKIAILDPADRAYPNVLLAAGEGLGYPSKITPEAVTKWDFNPPFDCIVFRKVNNDVYQAIVYVDPAKANFKFFETRGWANEKKSSDYTLPAILANDAAMGKTDGNWYGAAGAVAGNYKITINLATKVATAESITLP